jgi:hypothetical protein
MGFFNLTACDVQNFSHPIDNNPDLNTLNMHNNNEAIEALGLKQTPTPDKIRGASVLSLAQSFQNSIRSCWRFNPFAGRIMDRHDDKMSVRQ